MAEIGYYKRRDIAKIEIKNFIASDEAPTTKWSVVAARIIGLSSLTKKTITKIFEEMYPALKIDEETDLVVRK